MKAESRRADLDFIELRGLRMLQTLRILRAQTQFEFQAELKHDTSAGAIVFSGESTRKGLLQFPRPLVRYSDLVKLNHESSPIPYRARSSARLALA